MPFSVARTGRWIKRALDFLQQQRVPTLQLPRMHVNYRALTYSHFTQQRVRLSEIDWMWHLTKGKIFSPEQCKQECSQCLPWGRNYNGLYGSSGNLTRAAHEFLILYRELKGILTQTECQSALEKELFLHWDYFISTNFCTWKTHVERNYVFLKAVS